MPDGSLHEPWRDGWEPHPSKRDLLLSAVVYGACYTAKLDGEELPYDGARFHADELAAEGKLVLVPGVDLKDVKDFALWTPT